MGFIRDKARWRKGWRADAHGTVVDPACGPSVAEGPDRAGRAEAWRFWRERLGAPRFVLAPLLGQSDGPFRWLVRGCGVGLCYTPMYEAELLLDGRFDQELRESSDRPCVCQLAGSRPAAMLEAARLVEATGRYDAVDINLGCPQDCAKEGGYGVFQLARLEELARLVRALTEQLTIPVFCKIRCRSPDLADTVHVAETLEAAGCSALALHARQPEERDHAGPCDWECIRVVKQRLQIPLIANGSVQSLEQAERCLRRTGADAAMSGTGLLRRPWMLDRPGEWPGEPAVAACSRYLDMCRAHGAPRANGRALAKVIQDHLLAILQGPLGIDQGRNIDLWEAIFKQQSLQQFYQLMGIVQARIGGAEEEPCSLAQLSEVWGTWEPWE